MFSALLKNNNEPEFQVRLLVSELKNGDFALSTFSYGNVVVFFSSPGEMVKDDISTNPLLVVDARADSRKANARLNLKVRREADGTFSGQQNLKRKHPNFGWDECPFKCKNLEELLPKLGIITNDVIGVRYRIPTPPSNLWELYQTVLTLQKNPEDYTKLGVVRLKDGIVSQM